MGFVDSFIRIELLNVKNISCINSENGEVRKVHFC